MPGPEPGAVWIEDVEAGRYRAVFEPYFYSRSQNRLKRVKTILRRLVARTWRCQWCGDELPDYRRADAVYCREGCRKRAARDRRALVQSTS